MSNFQSKPYSQLMGRTPRISSGMAQAQFELASFAVPAFLRVAPHKSEVVR